MILSQDKQFRYSNRARPESFISEYHSTELYEGGSDRTADGLVLLSLKLRQNQLLKLPQNGLSFTKLGIDVPEAGSSSTFGKKKVKDKPYLLRP
jgi:hypothetical protein